MNKYTITLAAPGTVELTLPDGANLNQIEAPTPPPAAPPPYPLPPYSIYYKPKYEQARRVVDLFATNKLYDDVRKALFVCWITQRCERANVIRRMIEVGGELSAGLYDLVPSFGNPVDDVLAILWAMDDSKAGRTQ